MDEDTSAHLFLLRMDNILHLVQCADGIRFSSWRPVRDNTKEKSSADTRKKTTHKKFVSAFGIFEFWARTDVFVSFGGSIFSNTKDPRKI